MSNIEFRVFGIEQRSSIDGEIALHGWIFGSCTARVYEGGGGGGVGILRWGWARRKHLSFDDIFKCWVAYKSKH